MAPWDLTDNGASAMLLIELPEVGGPFELTVTDTGASFGMRVLAVDAAGTLSVPLADLFDICAAGICPDVSRLDTFSLQVFADVGAIEQRIVVSELRSVPEPESALLLLGGLMALGCATTRPAPPSASDGAQQSTNPG